MRKSRRLQFYIYIYMCVCVCVCISYLIQSRHCSLKQRGYASCEPSRCVLIVQVCNVTAGYYEATLGDEFFICVRISWPL
jgi:hypothetical protein